MEVLVQLADFLLKAAVSYVQTPQGQKELDDIENAAGDVIGDMLPFDAAATSQPPVPINGRVKGDPNRFKKRNVRS